MSSRPTIQIQVSEAKHMMDLRRSKSKTNQYAPRLDPSSEDEAKIQRQLCIAIECSKVMGAGVVWRLIIDHRYLSVVSSHSDE